MRARHPPRGGACARPMARRSSSAAWACWCRSRRAACAPWKVPASPVSSDSMKIRPFHFFIFWLALNLVQAAFTELTSDEGYYWFYSRSLEWGYYDHPPFIALMVRIGYALFPNELGVR